MTRLSGLCHYVVYPGGGAPEAPPALEGFLLWSPGLQLLPVLLKQYAVEPGYKEDTLRPPVPFPKGTCFKALSF
jgi:hypothetical protein